VDGGEQLAATGLLRRRRSCRPAEVGRRCTKLLGAIMRS
jgi:hypothetical protein